LQECIGAPVATSWWMSSQSRVMTIHLFPGLVTQSNANVLVVMSSLNLQQLLLSLSEIL